MPKVPSYSELQVTERPLPSARESSYATPAMFATQGEAFVQGGTGLLKSGAEVAQIAAKMQDRANVDAVFQAETLFKDELIKFDTEQRAKKGAAALADGGVTVQAEKWFAENVGRHVEGLTNPAQQRAFAQIADKLRTQTLESVSRHQAQEARQSAVDSSNAAIVSGINRAAANAHDWGVVDTEAKGIRAHVAALAKVNGYDDAVRDALTGEKLTLLHKQVIQQIVADPKTRALAGDYFKKYEGEIDGSQRAEIGEYARKATATSLGDGAADAIWKNDGPKSRTDPVKLSDMEERLRNDLKGNDEAIEKGIKALRERATAYRDQRKEEANALEAGVNGLILSGQPTAQVRRSPEFLRLSAQDPEAARKVDSFMENRDYMRVARAAAEAQRGEAEERRKQARLTREGLDTALRLSNPDALARMSRDQVVNLLPTLGNELTAQLVTKWDSLTKSETKLIEARIDKQDFDTIALGAGLRPNEPQKSEAEKDRLVRLQAQVENVIDAEQRTAGNKPLTRERKREIMQREIDNVVLIGGFFSDDRRPLAVLTPDEQKDAFVTVGPKKQKVMVSEIPPTFRAQAMNARRAQGLGTSEAQLAELWLRSTGKLK